MIAGGEASVPSAAALPTLVNMAVLTKPKAIPPVTINFFVWLATLFVMYLPLVHRAYVRSECGSGRAAGSPTIRVNTHGSNRHG
jgi:hypothetical protein